MQNPSTYALVLVFGAILTLLVGQLLIRAGKAFLTDIFGDEHTAASISRLLGVLFYLITLGVLALLSIVDLPTEGPIQTIIAKLGVVLLVLGVAHGATMLALIQLRNRRREQTVVDELSEQVQASRARQHDVQQYERHHHHEGHHHEHSDPHHHDADQHDQPPQPPPVAGGPTTRS